MEEWDRWYACLLGEWVCLNDDAGCKMGERGVSPIQWFKENGEIYAPLDREADQENSYYFLDYVHIHFRGRDYRIDPIFIQVVVS